MSGAYSAKSLGWVSGKFLHTEWNNQSLHPVSYTSPFQEDIFRVPLSHIKAPIYLKGPLATSKWYNSLLSSVATLENVNRSMTLIVNISHKSFTSKSDTISAFQDCAWTGNSKNRKHFVVRSSHFPLPNKPENNWSPLVKLPHNGKQHHLTYALVQLFLSWSSNLAKFYCVFTVLRVYCM